MSNEHPEYPPHERKFFTAVLEIVGTGKSLNIPFTEPFRCPGRIGDIAFSWLAEATFGADASFAAVATRFALPSIEWKRVFILYPQRHGHAAPPAVWIVILGRVVFTPASPPITATMLRRGNAPRASSIV